MSKSKKEFRLEDGTPVTSTETVYKAYASKRNKERYLKRRQAEYEKISLDDNSAYDIAAEDNTEETVEKEHEIAMLRHAIKTLTVREQGLIMDYFFNDYSWSHARRKFVDSIPENDKNSKAAKAVGIIDRAFVLEREARKANVPPEKILEMRQKEVRPIIEEFYNFIGTLRPSKGSHLGAAVTYALNQKDKLLLFLDHPEVEMTNNLAERTVKPFVIDRKNFLFSATDKGADASALFMSVIETAKRNGLNVFGYISYLMLVLPSWGKTPSEEQLDSIMPWSATLPETCHRTYHQIVENMAEVK